MKKIKRNEIPIYIPGRSNLKNIISERSYTPYDSIYTKMSKQKICCFAEGRLSGTQKEREIVSANGHKVSWG